MIIAPLRRAIPKLAAALALVPGISHALAGDSPDPAAVPQQPSDPASTPVQSGEPPTAAPNTWDKVLENDLAKAFTDGRFSFNARLRYEHAD